MSPAGRPPISGARKNGRLAIRVTDEEKAAIDAVAAAAGQPTTTWLRELALAAVAQLAAQQEAAKPAPKKPAKKKA